MKKHIAIIAAVCAVSVMLAGCNQDRKDYESAAYCQGKGLRPGDAGYDKCVSDEQTGRLMDQQHQDFDAMKQQQQDLHMQPNNGNFNR